MTHSATTAQPDQDEFCLTTLRFTKAGIDVDAEANEFQEEGARSFVKSWKELMACVGTKNEALK